MVSIDIFNYFFQYFLTNSFNFYLEIKNKIYLHIIFAAWGVNYFNTQVIMDSATRHSIRTDIQVLLILGERRQGQSELTSDVIRRMETLLNSKFQELRNQIKTLNVQLARKEVKEAGSLFDEDDIEFEKNCLLGKRPGGLPAIEDENACSSENNVNDIDMNLGCTPSKVLCIEEEN